LSTLLPVQWHQVPSVWEMAYPQLEKAVKRNKGFTMADIKEQLLRRMMQMWLSVTDKNEIEAVAITQMQLYPQKKTCFLLFLGGQDREHWKPFMDDLETWAIDSGCTDMEFIGRKGWAKIMTDFDPVETVYRKTLRTGL